MACDGAPAVRSGGMAPPSRKAGGWGYRRGGLATPPTQSAEPACRRSTIGPARPAGEWRVGDCGGKAGCAGVARPAGASASNQPMA
eukprot:scaffold4284_cov113-Isochrysis_galbana.AAC.1